MSGNIRQGQANVIGHERFTGRRQSNEPPDPTLATGTNNSEKSPDPPSEPAEDKTAPLVKTGGHDDPPDMDALKDLSVRLARVESALDWAKIAFGLTVSVMVGGFAFLGVQSVRLDNKIDAVATKLEAKIDAIPARLSEEFRAMRAEMSAQTSAIANSITATRAAAAPASPPPNIIINVPPYGQPPPLQQ